MFLLFLAVHCLVYWCACALFSIDYRVLCRGQLQFPLSNMYPSKLRAARRTIALQTVLMFPISATCDYLNFSITSTLSSGHLTWQMPLMIILIDAIFYHIHRVLHASSFLYTSYHAYHHRWRESITSIATFDAHVVEHFVLNILPILAVIKCVNVNTFGATALIAFATFNSVLAHSGYISTQGSHALHHKQNTINFGVGFMLFDRLYGTYQ